MEICKKIKESYKECKARLDEMELDTEGRFWLDDLEETFAKYGFYRFYSDEDTACYRGKEPGQQIDVGFIDWGPYGREVKRIFAMPNIKMEWPENAHEVVKAFGKVLRGK